jgi:alcohol dehydrogenase (cytochrome c)
VLCPFIAGGMSWNMGTYNPKTGMMYKVGNEWCMDLTVQKTTPVLEPMAQLNIGADFNITHDNNNGTGWSSFPLIPRQAHRKRTLTLYST